MMLLTLSMYDEMNTKGADVLVVELLFEVGLLIGTVDNDWILPDDIDNELMPMSGDYLCV